jgi:hypothetical protein
VAVRKKEYEWEVIRLRAKGEYLGKVRGVVKQFGITVVEAQQRLLIRRA